MSDCSESAEDCGKHVRRSSSLLQGYEVGPAGLEAFSAWWTVLRIGKLEDAQQALEDVGAGKAVKAAIYPHDEEG